MLTLTCDRMPAYDMSRDLAREVVCKRSLVSRLVGMIWVVSQ